MLEAIQLILDHHSWRACGVRYEMELLGVAFEQRDSPEGALRLLRVRLLARAGTMTVPARLDLVVELALLSELHTLLKDALQTLHEHLFQQAFSTASLRFAS